MAVRRNEVETTVDTIVFDVPTVESRLVPVELTELTVYVVFYRLPAKHHSTAQDEILSRPSSVKYPSTFVHGLITDDDLE